MGPNLLLTADNLNDPIGQTIARFSKPQLQPRKYSPLLFSRILNVLALVAHKNFTLIYLQTMNPINS